jgi:hypothetical protein
MEPLLFLFPSSLMMSLPSAVSDVPVAPTSESTMLSIQVPKNPRFRRASVHDGRDA